MPVRGCVLALALSGLAACDQVTTGMVDGLSRLGAPSDATAEGIRTMSMLGGDVRVRGPEGYCVDQGASNARRGFAVMAGCALMSDDAAVMPSLDGLITVQVGAADTASVTGNEAAFAAFLASEAGRSVLAGNGDVDAISAMDVSEDRTGVLVRFEDASGPSFPGTSGPQWRGFLDIDGRLATISILSFERAPLSATEGERLLVIAMAELAEVNAPAQVVELAEATE